MLKNKKILFILMLAMVLFLIPNICHATVEYTRNFPSNEGTIELNLTGLTLEDTKQYEFALVLKGGTPTDWFLITDFTTTMAKIPLSSSTSKIVNVLKQTDNGQLFIREKGKEDEYVVDRLNVNLKLPYLQSLVYSKTKSNYDIYGDGSVLYGSIGNAYKNVGGDYTHAQWKKVTDTKFITEFLKVKNSDGDVTTLEKYLPSYPTTGYSATRSPGYTAYNNGLYLLWVKRTGTNCKDVYSCIIHDGLPEATTVAQYLEGTELEGPTVKSIMVTSPQSGTYKTGQTVKIRVYFSETITGTTVPTLKIKFGESSTKDVSNGIIENKNSEHYIEYSYNIQAGDVGQLATVSLTGGNIVDASNNKAVLSCPVITGNTIKANVEGTVNTQTQNQDKNNITQNQNTGSQGGSGSTQKPSNSGTSNNDKDTTIKKDSKFPQTGAAMLSIMLVCVIAVAIIAKRKVNQYKDI